MRLCLMMEPMQHYNSQKGKNDQLCNVFIYLFYKVKKKKTEIMSLYYISAEKITKWTSPKT